MHAGAPNPPHAQSDIAPDLTKHELYVNRELSWLAFNQRVLDQAFDPEWPPLERVKFLAIFASNLDEFFMIRVAGLHEQVGADVAEHSPDGLGVRDQLARIREIVKGQVATASTAFTKELVPLLASNGVRIRDWASLSPEKQQWCRSYFRRAVYPVLTPLAVDPVHPFPFVSNLSLSLAVEVEDPVNKRARVARIKVPETLPRFVPIEDDARGGGEKERAVDRGTDLVPLEDIIANNVTDLFPGMNIGGCHPFRVTRDMDLDILEEEASDLMAVIDRELRRRRFGAAVRLELAEGLPDTMRRLLLEKLELEEDDVYETPAPLGLAGLFGVARLALPELHDPPLAPHTPASLPPATDFFSLIRERDVLLHHPYDSFSPVLDFLRSAAEDPDVLAIKMTLYRAGSNSEVVRALVRAGENHKQVAVSIELKARFDEENNIAWARELERAGVHVFYGTAGLKTHAKALLVVRREGAELRRYVHLSTGNYNATTAKLYTDLGLFTADDQIGEDTSELFNALSGFSRKWDHKKLAVAPVALRSTVLSKIAQQIELAQGGKPARIFAKLNALVDSEVIHALYRASSSGVDIQLIVRGVCCLRPSVPGVSENIRVHSLIGRFLEHERLFVFGPDGDEEVYLSSADWMPRNFDRRVEVLFPVASAAIRERLRAECMAPLAQDNCRAYDMHADGSYERRRPEGDSSRSDAQYATWQRVVGRARTDAAGHPLPRLVPATAHDSKSTKRTRP